MAESKYRNANIVYQTSTFASWVERTNQLVYDMHTIAVTAEKNPTGGVTTGNVVITSNVYNYDTTSYSTTTGGHLQANVIIATTNLRGGNITTSNTLLVVSNTDILSGIINVSSDGATSNTVRITGSYVDIQALALYVNNTTLQVSSNVHINSTSTNTSINSTSTFINGTLLDVDSTTVTVDGDAITFTANDVTIKSNSTISVIDINGNGTVSNTTVSGNTLTVSTNDTVINSNTTVQATSVTIDSNTYIKTNGTNVINVTSSNSTTHTITAGANDITVTADDVSFKTNSTITAISIDNDGTTTGITLAGNSLTVDSNAYFTAANVTIGSDSSDRVYVKGKVGNSTVGVIPNGNNVPFGNSTNKWVVTANSVTANSLIANTSNAQSLYVTVNAHIGYVNATHTSLYVDEDQANVTVSTTFDTDVDVAGTLTVSGGISVGSNIELSVNTSTISTLTVTTLADINGDTDIGASDSDTLTINAKVDSGIIPSGNTRLLGNTTNAWNIYSTSIRSSSYKDINGNAFTIKYSNGTVAWPAA